MSNANAEGVSKALRGEAERLIAEHNLDAIVIVAITDLRNPGTESTIAMVSAGCDEVASSVAGNMKMAFSSHLEEVCKDSKQGGGR